MALRMSEHFCGNWLRRVGNWPTPDMLRKVLREAVKVQHCRDLLEKDGTTPFRMLAVYWHPELNVVVTVDHIAGKVVSVLSEANFNPERMARCTAKHITAP